MKGLLESETLYEIAFHNAPVGIAVIAPNGRFLKMNTTACELVGYSEAELSGMTFQMITGSGDCKNELPFMHQLIEQKLPVYQMNTRFIHKLGYMKSITMNVSLVMDEYRQPGYFILHFWDSAAVKQNENNSLFINAFHHAPIGISLVAMNGRFLMVNPSLCETLGYSKAEFMNMTVQMITYPEDLEVDLHSIKEVLEQKISHFQVRKRYIHKQGHMMWVSLNVSLVHDDNGKPLHYIFQIQNLTDQVQMADLYTIISENAMDIISYTTPDGVTCYISPSIKHILGYDSEEVIGTPVNHFIHPDDIEPLARLVENSPSDEQVVCYRTRHKDGHYIWLETQMKLIRTAQGDIEKVLGIARDVTRRKEAEDALRNSKENFRCLIENFQEAIGVATPEEWIYVTDALVKLFGFTNKEKFMNKDFIELIHPDDHELFRKRMEAVFRGDSMKPAELKIIQFNGRVVDIEVKSISTLFEGRPVIHSIFRDITERKKTQELLQQSEKLSVAGQLAAGIAHEIRNPLTSLKGFLHLINSGTKTVSHYYDIMNSELNRIELILNELLILSKPHVAHMGTADARVVLEHVIALLETQANLSNVEINKAFDSGVLLIECDVNQIKQVFINFMKNAIEAMPKGGAIQI